MPLLRAREPWAFWGLFLGLWLLLMIGGRSNFLRDPGTFWHTVVGERILDEGFTRDDAYSFTRSDTEWIPHQWLGEVTMALVHRISGFDGLLAGTITLLAAMYAAIGTRWLRTGLHPIACIMFIGLTLAASATHFHIRPHLVTILGTFLTMMMLIEVERCGVRELWWLVPFYMIWVNTHGGVMGGMAMLGIAGVGWTLLALFQRESPIRNGGDFVQLAAIGTIIGLSIAVTPYGLDIARTWLVIMNAPMLPLVIEEHQATNFSDPSTIPFLMLAVFYLSMLLLTPRCHWRVSWFLPLFWLVQAIFRVRHAPLFAVVASLAMAEMLPTMAWFQRLGERRPDFVKLGGRFITIGWLGIFGVVAWFGIILAIQSTGTTLPIIGRGWAKHDPQLWPVEMLPTLQQYQPIHKSEGHIFNEYIDGGFLIYHCPNYRVFIDDRCELYGDQWIYDYVKHAGNEQFMNDWQREYGNFDFALTRVGSGFDGYFQNYPETWELIRGDELTHFYKRKD